jgi:hypothetical protein
MKFTMILGSAAALVLASATATSAAPSGSTSVSPAVVAVSAPLALTAVQQTTPPPKAEIKVDIDSSPNTVWYMDPVWIAVGAIALLIVIVLAVMAARGGSDRTTVVR